MRKCVICEKALEAPPYVIALGGYTHEECAKKFVKEMKEFLTKNKLRGIKKGA